MNIVNLQAFVPGADASPENKQAQRALVMAGCYRGDIDGLFWTNSQTALGLFRSSYPTYTNVIWTPDCTFPVFVDGDDLVIRNATATCFGGKYDKGDDGKTESGILNDGSDPSLMLVALPIRSTEAATRGSPLAFTGPHIPWRTPVKVWRETDGEASAATGLLADDGPDVEEYPGHAMDLNPPLVLAHFAPNEDPRNVANDWAAFGISCRIIGAAKFVC